MENKRKRKRHGSLLLMLVLIMTALFASSVRTTQAQNSSAPNSQPSATPVDEAALRRACAEAVEELQSARKVIDAQDKEIKVKAELIELEKQISDGMKNLRSMDAAQVAELQKALNAKDRVIAAYEAEIVVLKKNKWSWWKVTKTAIVAGAAGIVIGTVLN